MDKAVPVAEVFSPPVMDTVVEWIGFYREATKEHICDEGFDTFDDLVKMKERGIHTLAESCRSPRLRTVAKWMAIFLLCFL